MQTAVARCLPSVRWAFGAYHRRRYRTTKRHGPRWQRCSPRLDKDIRPEVDVEMSGWHQQTSVPTSVSWPMTHQSLLLCCPDVQPTMIGFGEVFQLWMLLYILPRYQCPKCNLTGIGHKTILDIVWKTVRTQLGVNAVGNYGETTVFSDT